MLFVFIGFAVILLGCRRRRSISLPRGEPLRACRPCRLTLRISHTSRPSIHLSRPLRSRDSLQVACTRCKSPRHVVLAPFVWVSVTSSYRLFCWFCAVGALEAPCLPVTATAWLTRAIGDALLVFPSRQTLTKFQTMPWSAVVGCGFAPLRLSPKIYTARPVPCEPSRRAGGLFNNLYYEELSVGCTLLIRIVIYLKMFFSIGD